MAGRGVSIYGLSTEGYLIANEFAKKGYRVSLIDERWNICMGLKPELLTESAGELLSGDSLLGLSTIEEAMKGSEYVFIAPKVRSADEIGALSRRMKPLLENIPKGSIVINNIPASYNWNQMNLRFIERMSGLSSERDFTYVYMPLFPGSARPMSAGSTKPEDAEVLLKGMGFEVGVSGLALSELRHFSRVVKSYEGLISSLEVCRRIHDPDERLTVARELGFESYIDGISSYVLDLRLMLKSFRTGDPLLYWASSAVKAIENYIKFLVDEVKRAIKVAGWRASKTRIFLMWSIDEYEIRGGRAMIRDQLAERLRDYIGEVVVVEGARRVKDSLTLFPERSVLVLACSERDFREAEGLKHRRNVKIVKANLVAEVIG